MNVNLLKTWIYIHIYIILKHRAQLVTNKEELKLSVKKEAEAQYKEELAKTKEEYQKMIDNTRIQVSYTYVL